MNCLKLFQHREETTIYNYSRHSRVGGNPLIANKLFTYETIILL